MTYIEQAQECLTRLDDERRIRLWAADCAAHVLHLFEAESTSTAPRTAIKAARSRAKSGFNNYADGAASAALNEFAPSWAAHYAARAAGLAAAADMRLVIDAVSMAALAAARVDARDSEETWQAERFALLLSDSPLPDWPVPARGVAA